MVSGVVQGLGRDARAQAELAIADLESSATEWRDNAGQIRQIKDEIDRLRIIEGWEGPAAQEYARVCVVQGNANNTIAILKDALSKTYDAAHGKPVAASAAELEAQVKKTWGAPNLLTTPDKWPSGTDMVDRVAGQTNQVEAPTGR